MNLEVLNAIYLVGVILMIIASARTSRFTARIRAANERRCRRMAAAYGRCE